MNKIYDCLNEYQTQLVNKLKTSTIIRHTHPPVDTLQADCAYCQLYGNVAMQDVVVESNKDELFLFLKQ
jgi:hypothetical protein